MVKQVLYFGSQVRLKIQNKQLCVTKADTGEERTFPLEDVGLVEIDSPQVSLTGACLQGLVANGVVVIVCDDRHHPTGILLPLTGHTLQQKHQRAQLEAPRPLAKQLWRDTVVAKIQNQAGLLKIMGGEYRPLQLMCKGVKSGDSENVEGSAARYYWTRLTNDPYFRRAPEGPPPNNFFNYAYTVLRAIIARAIVGAGLLPALGIFHRNQYNPFPLADDLMEPFRPVADALVMRLLFEQPGCFELNRSTKSVLLQLTAAPVLLNGEQTALQTAASRTCASLVRVYLNETKTILYPELCPSVLTESCGW